MNFYPYPSSIPPPFISGSRPSNIHTHIPSLYSSLPPPIPLSLVSLRQSAVVDVRGVGKKRITLNTYAVQEKAAALDTLVRWVVIVMVVMIVYWGGRGGCRYISYIYIYICHARSSIHPSSYPSLSLPPAIPTQDRYARVLGWRFAEHAEALPEVKILQQINK